MGDMHSIQIGKNVQWDSAGNLIAFAKHACFPNVKFTLTWPSSNADDPSYADALPSAISIIALKNIEAGELITVNYNSFENYISCDFLDVDTQREVRGFDYVKEDEKHFLVDNDLLFPHLLK